MMASIAVSGQFEYNTIELNIKLNANDIIDNLSRWVFQTSV